MMTLQLVECTDYDVFYGVLQVENPNITADDIQEKIHEFKNSYKAYGFDSLEDMKASGYETEEDLVGNACPEWDVDQLVYEAFPESWGVNYFRYDGLVSC